MPLTKNAENPTFREFYRKIIITSGQQKTSGERRAQWRRGWRRNVPFPLKTLLFLFNVDLSF
jgi:hypothetical protein